MNVWERESRSNQYWSENVESAYPQGEVTCGTDKVIKKLRVEMDPTNDSMTVKMLKYEDVVMK